MSSSIDLLTKLLLQNEGSKDLLVVFKTGVGSVDYLGRLSLQNKGSEDLLARGDVRGSSSKDLLSVLSIQGLGSENLLAVMEIRNEDSRDFVGTISVRNKSSKDYLEILSVRGKGSKDFLSRFRIRERASVDLASKLAVRHRGSRDLIGITSVQNKSTRDLSAKFQIPSVPIQWALRRSIDARLGMSAKDLGDLAMEDFISEGMLDVKGELDVQEISYSSWTRYPLVPNQIKRATMYATIEIIIARKLQSFKSRVIPSIGPLRYEVVERDSMKAINYFHGKRMEAIDKYVATQAAGGSYMSSSTIDEEPVFDMKDLQDKAAGEVDGETSWFRWLLGR